MQNPAQVGGDIPEERQQETGDHPNHDDHARRGHLDLSLREQANQDGENERPDVGYLDDEVEVAREGLLFWKFGDEEGLLQQHPAEVDPRGDAQKTTQDVDGRVGAREMPLHSVQKEGHVVLVLLDLVFVLWTLTLCCWTSSLWCGPRLCVVGPQQ